MPGLFENKTIPSIFADIRKHFSDRRAEKNGHALHWGQFLDNVAPVAGQQPQVGLYGGVAACLAYGAASRAGDVFAVAARNDLVNYWRARTSTVDPEPENNLRQNVRVAFLLLGLTFGTPVSDITVSEVWDLLKSRLVPTDGLWGDAEFPGATQHPSEYSTAIILILLAVIRRTGTGSANDFSEIDQTRRDVGIKLQESLLGDRQKVRPFKNVLLVAIMLSLQKKADKGVKSELNSASLGSIDIKWRHTHFFDFRKRNGDHSRDYLILPVGMLGAFLLYGSALPARHYLYATRVLGALETSLSKSPNKLFMEGERPSTIEQGLLVLALQAWLLPKEWKEYSLWIPRFWWWANRDNDFNRWWVLLFGLALYGPIAIVTTGEFLIKFLTEQDLLLSAIPFIKVSLLLPKWALATIGVIAGVVAKPQDLLRVLFGKKK